MSWHPPVAALLVLAASASHASNCESIRAGIDAKIRAAGAKAFTLSTLPTEAHTTGKVVGTCDQGAMKIVYVQDAAPARPTPQDERILTECKDGSVSVGGDCRK